VDAKNAVLRWRGSSFERWTSAGPKPSCEKLKEKSTTTSAAATTPKSAGDRSRVSTTSTPIFSTAIAPLPQATQTMPLMARWVRLGGVGSCTGSLFTRLGYLMVENVVPVTRVLAIWITTAGRLRHRWVCPEWSIKETTGVSQSQGLAKFPAIRFSQVAALPFQDLFFGPARLSCSQHSPWPSERPVC
jgi:hypothetical protein